MAWQGGVYFVDGGVTGKVDCVGWGEDGAREGVSGRCGMMCREVG